MDVRLAWYVPESGHIWKKRDGVQRLVWKQEVKSGFAKKYRPEFGLFREFAALNVTRARGEDAIRRFADKYGDIAAVPGNSFYQLNARGHRQIQRPNASLRVWKHQVEQMRWAVNLWNQSNEGGRGKASRLQARNDLQIEVESALRDITTPSCARVCLNERLELFVHPVNLLAFMWLTLARLLSGEIEERLCAICEKKRFYVGSGLGLNRGDKVACGAACRKQKQRQENELSSV